MRRTCLLALALLLAACGGDDDSTGSSPILPGAYRGTLTLTVAAGPATTSQGGPITIRVTPDQVVAAGNFPPVPAQGSSFTSSLPAAALDSVTLTCPQGTFGLEGTFRGTTVSGTPFGAGIVCNGFPAAVTGAFAASLQTETRQGRRDADVLHLFRETILRALSR
ncbi:MAG TPA: hypothetical protein VHF87_04130 [Methylomirabilota bacterium]|jgi:hypothetical protein|nr:hypothetical protein [Methylomirabilota bacterium]